MTILEFKKKILPEMNYREAALQLKEDPKAFYPGRKIGTIMRYGLQLEKLLGVWGYEIEVKKAVKKEMAPTQTPTKNKNAS